MIYVGIDVAKDKHDCFITNSDGEVLFKAFTITNNLDGFNELHQKIATDAGLKISHDNDSSNTQADIAQALKDLNSTIQQQNQQPTQQRQAPQPRGPRRWR